MRLKKKLEEGKPTRYYSKNQEKKVAKSLNGKVTKNSGATLFDKGDVKTSQFLIECKTKTSPSKQITIKKEWLEKLLHEQIQVGADYRALVFDFGDNGSQYSIIPFELFQQLVTLLEE